MGPDAFYTMFHLDGRSVAALYPAGGRARRDAAAVAVVRLRGERRTSGRSGPRTLGGTVLMEPFDVLDVGRMAMVQDPTGAVVALWEPRRHAGAGVVGEASAMCWNELGTTDTARAGAFYDVAARLVGRDPGRWGPSATPRSPRTGRPAAG